MQSPEHDACRTHAAVCPVFHPVASTKFQQLSELLMQSRGLDVQTVSGWLALQALPMQVPCRENPAARQAQH